MFPTQLNKNQSKTLDSLGDRTKAADRAWSRVGEEVHPKPGFFFGFWVFYLHPQGFFLKIWVVLQDFGRGLRHCHGVSTEQWLCFPNKRNTTSSLEPNPQLPHPSNGLRFHPEGFCRSQFLWFSTYIDQFSGQCLPWVLQRRAHSDKHSPHVSEIQTPRSAINSH